RARATTPARVGTPAGRGRAGRRRRDTLPGAWRGPLSLSLPSRIHGPAARFAAEGEEKGERLDDDATGGRELGGPLLAPLPQRLEILRRGDEPPHQLLVGVGRRGHVVLARAVLTRLQGRQVGQRLAHADRQGQ